MSSSGVEEHYLPRRDSLEYFIKFPPPISSVDKMYPPNDCAECDFNFATDDSTTPIVLLLGWAGCQDKHLMKYSKIYEDRGLITVRYTAPYEEYMRKWDAMRPIGQKIVKLLCDMSFDTNPIIIHAFSNGGAILYQSIDIAMKEFQTPLDICGIIFDSSPGECRLLPLYRCVLSIYGEKKRFSNILCAFFALGLYARWAVGDLYLRIKSIFTSTPVPRAVDAYQDLKYLDNYTPQLFLYRYADKLVWSCDVESFANFRQSLGVPVETACFHDAEHVKLFIKYPQKYIQCVCTFISNCLMSIPILKEANQHYE